MKNDFTFSTNSTNGNFVLETSEFEGKLFHHEENNLKFRDFSLEKVLKSNIE